MSKYVSRKENTPECRLLSLKYKLFSSKLFQVSADFIPVGFLIRKTTLFCRSPLAWVSSALTRRRRLSHKSPAQGPRERQDLCCTSPAAKTSSFSTHRHPPVPAGARGIREEASPWCHNFPGEHRQAEVTAQRGPNGHGWETTPKRAAGCPLPTARCCHLSRASTGVVLGGREAQLNLPITGSGKQHPSFGHWWAPRLPDTAVRAQPSKGSLCTLTHKHTGCTASSALHLKHRHVTNRNT